MQRAARARLFGVLFAAALAATAHCALPPPAAVPARAAASRDALITARDPTNVRAATGRATRTKVMSRRAAARVFAAYISARQRHAAGIARDKLGVADVARIALALRDTNDRREAVERRRSLAGQAHSWRGRPRHLYTGYTYRPPRASRSLRVPPLRQPAAVLSEQGEEDEGEEDGERVERGAMPASAGFADDAPSPTPTPAPTPRVVRGNVARETPRRAQRSHVHAHAASHASHVPPQTQSRMRGKDAVRVDARMCAALLVALCLAAAAAAVARRRVAFDRARRALLRRLRRLHSPPRAWDAAA